MAKRKFDPVHPGVVLAEDFVKGLEISQYRLAKANCRSAGSLSSIVREDSTSSFGLLAIQDRWLAAGF